MWYSHPDITAELVLPEFMPGTNGLKYSAIARCVYYTSTQQKLFCQVHVNATTLGAEGEAEVIATGMPGDDLIIDDTSASRSLAYVTTPRDNTFPKVPLDRESGASALTMENIQIAVQGGEQAEEMLGPTAGAWVKSKEGKSAYFTTDGGLKNPLGDGAVRTAKVVRVDFD